MRKAFKRTAIAGCVLLGTAAGCFVLSKGWASYTQPRPGESARAVLDRAEYDFGTVSPGMTVTGHAVVQNRGGRRLIVREEGGDCGCSSPQTREPLVVTPGCSGRLTFTFETPPVPGVARETRTFVTNDPTLPEFSLNLRAEVR
jgi:hypothetical protein